MLELPRGLDQIPETYKIGGHRMQKTTILSSDSSLEGP